MWKDSYLLGVENIDRQHKNLFITIDKLKRDLKENVLANNIEAYNKRLTETILFLKSYAIEHFRDEEKYYLSIGFKDLDRHKKIHSKLEASVSRYETALIQSNFSRSVVKEFLGFLATWLVYHVAGEDLIALKPAKTDIIEEYSNILLEFAKRTKGVLETISGLPNEDIKFKMTNRRDFSEGICYRIVVFNTKDTNVKKDVGFVYTEEMAFNTIKAMMGMEMSELNEIAYSALQEVSNITGSKIADILSVSGLVYDITPPESVELAMIPAGMGSFTVNSQLGKMGVIMY
ncbi:MAG: hemerythrin domain-containing protein [Turicibacter sp.]|nr:hemerythrin domain-containing protein [Turicibacter sp.]